jgi:PKD repeat protein
LSEPRQYTDIFPLEQLFRRLELAGFTLSPADRLRALHVLTGPAKAYLHDPQQLKELLAPVIARSAAGQAKFYELFDLYYHDITLPLAAGDPVAPTPWPAWLRWSLLALLALAMAGGIYALAKRPEPKNELAIYIDGPTSGVPGDTLLFENQSKYAGDSAALSWEWSYVNPDSLRVEITDTAEFNWQLIVPALLPGSSAYRKIHLRVYEPSTDSLYTTSIPFTVECRQKPAISGIKGPQQLSPGEKKNYEAQLPPVDLLANNAPSTSHWEYQWNFGDGTPEETKTGNPEINHTYREKGKYQLTLTVSDPTQSGFCSRVQTLEIRVGQELAFLPQTQLQTDQLQVMAVWGWGFYALLGLLGLGLLYYWVRWLTLRKKPDAPAEEKPLSAEEQLLYARFAHSDKAPYFIPLRNKSKQIALHPAQLRLADALRLRQEGLRREIDVENTLQATIDMGGFPQVRYLYASQPSEYLFLVDEQNRASHLGHLFKHLAQTLRGQDVNVELYYYRLHFSRFWNQYYPQGRTLGQLQGNYSNHRLVVLGDLHDLIDPYAKGQPDLRPLAANTIGHWPQRLLLTPVPPVSWSYREKLLARIFRVLPADNEGLVAAALQVENETRLLPDGRAFDQWQTTQTLLRHDSDTEHRKWRRWRDIQDYLSAYDPDLQRWFKALAVFPVPSWEMTIAIGQALEIPITYDKLLQLEERFDERLRQELLSELNSYDEAAAREAVRAELEAVKVISNGSHAYRDLETSLAIQDLALEPYDEAHRTAVRFLLRTGMLTPAQEAELDRVAERKAGGPSQAMSKVASFQKAPVTAREWLAEDGEEPLAQEPEPPELLSQDNNFRRAVMLTLAYLVLFAVGWTLGGTDTLYRLTFGAIPQPQVSAAAPEPLRNYFFVKETEVIDSAIIYNNQGVGQALAAAAFDTTAAPTFRRALASANSLFLGNGEVFRGESVNYALANANLSSVYFNVATQYLNAYLKDSLQQTILPEALRLLNQAYISDSTALEVLHAKGVVHFYNGSPRDSAQYYYDLLSAENYFDRLEYTPNLATLMGQERSRILTVVANELEKQALEVVVDYYFNSTLNRALSMVVTPLGKGNQPSLAQRNGLETGANSLTFRFDPPNRNPGELASIQVLLRATGTTEIVDSLSIAYPHPWQLPKVVTPRAPLAPTTVDPRGKNIPPQQQNAPPENNPPAEFVPATRVGSPNCPANSTIDATTGTCWTCPTGFKLINQPKGDKPVCTQEAPKKYAKAIDYGPGRGKMGSDCSGDQVFDATSGRCFSCPNGYIRAPLYPISGNQACQEQVLDRFAAATPAGNPTCGGNSFFDAIDGGSCWTCPTGYVRTLNSVKGDKACQLRGNK